ncbi:MULTISPECIES: hypothetical protein [Bacillaceae]|uniref:Uncharacterized protein n=1 Tax=Peribacillus huizhouensis TaxID=1501239 RepID=A0ABR6CLG0_9BACI|nr:MULTISPECIES: hypothetical protein [Bacillaceae]MBA9025883.1 hypothetical protein [Peribacillus huizhouensis]
MLYYAIPRLSLTAGGLTSLFSAAWLLFALFAIAGNLTAILYSPKKVKKHKASMNKKKRIHYYQ